MLHAAEQDSEGLIDGVVAGEPVTQLPTTTGYGISVGGAAVSGYGKKLADYTTYGNIYQPCAALAVGAAMTEISVFNYLTLTAPDRSRPPRAAPGWRPRVWSPVPTWLRSRLDALATS